MRVKQRIIYFTHFKTLVTWKCRGFLNLSFTDYHQVVAMNTLNSATIINGSFTNLRITDSYFDYVNYI